MFSVPHAAFLFAIISIVFLADRERKQTLEKRQGFVRPFFQQFRRLRCCAIVEIIRYEFD